MQPSFSNSPDIRSSVEEALQNLAKEKGNEIAERIKPILYANLDRGRVQTFIDGEIGRVHNYVGRVVDNYLVLSPLIKKLQIERAPEVWEPLSEKLQVWAYNFMLRKNFQTGMSSLEIARECANVAALTILDAHFPYDVDIEPWAHVIVQNVCRKFIRNETKKSAVPQQNIVELEETLSTQEDPVLARQKLQEDNRDILNAVAQLPNSRRRVVELLYFEELPPAEIAKQLEKSVSAVHSLHFNALQDLRRILITSRKNMQ